jgi:hypothetical protein
MPLPSNVSYGTVYGRFILAYGDTIDSGLEPDAVPAAGSVFFTASPILLKNASASPDPVTILPAPVEVQLDDDGYIRAYEGETGLGVRLVATDDPDNNPVGWTWRVDFRLTDETGTPVTLPSFSFSLPSNTEVDLTELSPVPSADGTFYLVGPTGPTGAAGPSTVLTVSGTTTGAPGSSASVDISGTSPSQSLAFTIPRGDQGIQGIQGIQGEQGIQGIQGIQGEVGPEGPQGVPGEGLTVLGTVATVGDLPATGNTEADAYIVAADGHLYIWSLGDPDFWLDAGQIQGPPGEGIPTGGDTGDILIKLSSTDYDTAWTNTIDGGSA